MDGSLFLPQVFQISPGLGNILQESRQGFATIIGAGGTIFQVTLKRIETDTTLCTVADRPSTCHAAIAEDIFCGDRGGAEFHPPFCGYLFQSGLVVGLGSNIGLAFGAIESAGSIKGLHGVTS